MTYFVKLENGFPTGNPIIEANFRQIFPHTSFPKYFKAEDVEPLGFGIYDFSSPPEASLYEKVIELSPLRSDSGIWRQQWSVIEMTEPEKLEVDATKAKIIRQERNARLTNTDWVVVFHTEKGTNIPLEWETYRQALRDITVHPNFPYLLDDDWPVKPD